MGRGEAAVQHFHEQLDAGQFDAIYEASAQDMKEATPRDKFVAFLDAVHRKLGAVKTASQEGWNVNYQTSGSFITMTYKTAFSDGDAVEQFTFRISGEQALLVGYHVNSEALVLK